MRRALTEKRMVKRAVIAAKSQCVVLLPNFTIKLFNMPFHIRKKEKVSTVENGSYFNFFLSVNEYHDTQKRRHKNIHIL